MYDRDKQYGFDELERKMSGQIQVLTDQIAVLENQVGSVRTAVAAIPSGASFAEINNILDNSHPEWSTEAYTTEGILPETVTDLNRESYNWYRQPRADTELVKSSANAVKGVGHTLFAASEGANLDIPRWNVPVGEASIGGLTQHWDLCFQLPTDLVFPGLTYYLQFEVVLATPEAPPADLQFFAGFYDNTLGQRKYIEGGSFTITGEIFGTPGASAVSYQVKAFTDANQEAISNILAFTNAPAVFDQNNHPRINVRGAPGFIKFEIYRLKGGVYTLQGEIRNAIESTFFDVGNAPIRTVSAFPALTATPVVAYARTRTFEPGTIIGTGFIRHSMTILVPTTYNSSLTLPGQQWLRMGLTNFTASAGQIIIRRLGLSQGEGMWSRSPNDVRQGAHSPRTSIPTSSRSGGSGNPVLPPDPPGSGSCVLMDTLINVMGGSEILRITMQELADRCRSETMFVDSAGAVAGKVLSVKVGSASTLYHISVTGGFQVSCTHDHPFITSLFDLFGTPAERLKVGDELQVKIGPYVQKATIEKIRKEYGSFEVGIPVQEGSHLCVLNGFISHNLKDRGELP